jgi:hypothetical protein
MTPWSRSNLIFAVAVFSLLAPVLAVNALVDPYNITMWITRTGLNAELPALELEEAMGLLLIVLVLFVLFGGGGYYGYRRWR